MRDLITPITHPLQNTHFSKCKDNIIYFAENFLGVQLTPFQVRVLELLEKPKNTTSRRAPHDHPLVSVDMHRIGIRAVSTTAHCSGLISIEVER